MTLLLTGGEYGLYEYKFVRVDVDGMFTRKPKADYQLLIEQYAKDGWRLVQIFAPAVSIKAGGVPDYFELILEKEIE